MHESGTDLTGPDDAAGDAPGDAAGDGETGSDAAGDDQVDGNGDTGPGAGLATYGWGPRVEAAWRDAVAGRRAEGLVPGRVVRAQYTHALVATAEGPRTVEAAGTVPSDRLAEANPSDDGDPTTAPPVTTGDWVAIDPSPDPPLLIDALPRWSELVRMDALGRDRQVLAANLDVGFVVHGADRPLKAGRIERTAALVWDCGAVPVLVLNKIDVVDPETASAVADELAPLVPGAEVIMVSARTGEGVGSLESRIGPGRTAVLLGESGAGKSTLVNRLLADSVADTGAVRSGDSKGRHTTTTRELFPVPGGGVVIDTPGIRAVGLVDADDGVAQVFADIVELAETCRFSDCAHQSEPGCAVTAAVTGGSLDPQRLARYLAVQAEMTEADRLAVERERKRRGRIEAKAARRLYRERPGRR